MYSRHLIALKAGTTPQQFERFWCDEWSTGPQLPGVTWRLLRGDRGDRNGGYLLFGEIDSLALRDHYFPVPGPSGEVSSEVREWMAAADPGLLAKWNQLATSLDVIYTDYVEVG